MAAGNQVTVPAPARHVVPRHVGSFPSINVCPVGATSISPGAGTASGACRAPACTAYITGARTTAGSSCALGARQRRGTTELISGADVGSAGAAEPVGGLVSSDAILQSTSLRGSG